MGIGLPKFWCRCWLAGTLFVLAEGFPEAVEVVDLVAGMALEDAMLCAMFPLAGIDLSPAGLVTGEVAVGGLGVLSDVGLPPPEVVLPFLLRVLGCLLAVKMPI